MIFCGVLYEVEKGSAEWERVNSAELREEAEIRFSGVCFSVKNLSHGLISRVPGLGSALCACAVFSAFLELVSILGQKQGLFSTSSL